MRVGVLLARVMQVVGGEVRQRELARGPPQPGGRPPLDVEAEIADKLDALACQVEARSKLFESVEARTPNHVEKAQTLLRLAASGIFTEGKLAAEARTRILSYLGKPGFLAGYLAATKKEGEPQESEKVMAELIVTLGKIGITPETGLKSIAA